MDRWARGLWARVATLLIVAATVVVLPQRPVPAAETDVITALAARDVCSVEEWKIDPGRCLSDLGDVVDARRRCLQAPTPDTPVSGVGGWYAEREAVGDRSGFHGYYTIAGYAATPSRRTTSAARRRSCTRTTKFENTIANVEFMIPIGIVGAANAVRDRAWNPGLMWSWADPLVEQATRAIYERVFTVFGMITLALVGLYLLWRSRPGPDE